jgi:hypothetical protein
LPTPQCGGILVRLVAGPLPWALALALHSITIWCFYILISALFALSCIRVFIVVKVTVDLLFTRPSPGLNYCTSCFYQVLPSV